MHPASANDSVNRLQSTAWRGTPDRTVALVDAGPEALTQLGRNLETGRYTLTFLDSRMRPHADIKYLCPSFIVFFMRLESPAACHLLTLLNLDPDTRNIPVLILLATDRDEDGDVVDAVTPSAWIQ